jgi:pSer/pThr/pTyr-binding forkhead associated (FHA) protein
MIPMYGELLPVGGGDPIPLLKPDLLVGRREGADIVLRFPNVSGHHCELTLGEGYWTVKDLRSSNGTKVNGTRVTEHQLKPGDKLTIANHEYEIAFDPLRLGAAARPEEKTREESIFSRSLLETAGLEGRRSSDSRSSPDRSRRPAT